MQRALVIAVAAALVGCGGNGPESLPAACTAGPGPIEKALAAAPAQVRVGGVPLSHCFTRDASADDVQIVGTNLLAVAQQLSDEAAPDPEGAAALRLGYLVGASRRGATRNGLAAELVRRLEQKGARLPAPSSAYRRGLRAGLAKG